MMHRGAGSERGGAGSKIQVWAQRGTGFGFNGLQMGPVRFKPWVGSNRTDPVREVHMGCEPISFHFPNSFLFLLLLLPVPSLFSLYLCSSSSLNIKLLSATLLCHVISLLPFLFDLIFLLVDVSVSDMCLVVGLRSRFGCLRSV